MLVALSLSGYPLSAIVSVTVGLGESSISAILFRGGMLFLSLALLAGAIVRLHGSNWVFKFDAFSTPFVIIFVLFVGLYTFRLLWDFFVVRTNTYTPMGMYFLIFFCAILFPCLASFSQPNIDFAKVYKVVVICLILTVICNVVFGAKHYLIQQVVEVARIKNEKLNPISFGHLCASLLIVCIFHKYFLNQSLGLVWKVAFLFALAGLLLANSKGPILSFFLVVSYMLHVRFSGRLWAKITIFTAMFSGSLISVWLVKLYTGIDVLSRFKSAFSSTEESSTSRVEGISLALAQFFENPIFGDSIVVKPAMGYPHNIIIETLMALGVLGVMVLSILILYALYCTNRLARKWPHYSWPGFLFFQYLLGAQTSGALWNSTVFWFFLCFVVVVYCHLNREGGAKIVL